MSKTKKSFIAWKCSECGVKHKNEIYCGVMQGNKKYYWEWKCDKCGKVNKIDCVIIMEEGYDRWRNQYYR